MITLLVCGYAYTVWLLTGVNPLPHVSIGLSLIAIFESIIEGVFILLIIQIIKCMR